MENSRTEWGQCAATDVLSTLGPQTSTRTLMIGIHSATRWADTLERRRAANHECRPQSRDLQGPAVSLWSAAACWHLMCGESKLKRLEMSTQFLAISSFLFPPSLFRLILFCLPLFSYSPSLAMSLFGVSQPPPPPAPQARAWWQL